jgi:ATP-dependent Lon protease
MCCALLSELTNTPVAPHLAMTGEVTLQGRVLGIGGLKEKLLAAKQHDMKKVLVPQENFDDAQDVLKETNLEGMQIVYVNTMDDVVAHAFDKKPLKQKAKPKSKKKKTTKKTI